MGHSEHTQWFRSNGHQMQASKIDAEAGILHDVVMVQEGPAKGHGVHLDAEFVEKITAYDNRYFKKNGLKARFGHPTASGETMGTQLGAFYNFRTRKNDKGMMEEIADLHLLEVADESPTHPGMRSWVLKMAAERPDFLMSSIVFSHSGIYQKVEGQKKFLNYDEYGYPIKILEDDPIFVDFEEKKGARHYYTDLVEQGAATDHLFSHTVNTHLFAVQAEAFLNEHPEILEFVKNNPDAVSGWMQRAGYTLTATKKKSMFNFKEWLTGGQGTPGEEELTQLRTGLNEAKAEFTKAQQQIEELTKARDKAVAELADATKATEDKFAALQSQITDLQTQLAKAPADTPTGAPAPTGTPAPTADRAYKSNPLNKHLYGGK